MAKGTVKSEMDTLKQESLLLRRQNKELNRFISSVSHDLKAPLRSIIGITDIARSESDDPVQGKYLGMIMKSAVKLENFISDLTDMTRNTQMELSCEQIDFSSLVQDVTESLTYMDGFSSIKIETDINAHNFHSDPTRVRIIFNNIISNAIKYQKKNAPGGSFLIIRIKMIKGKAILEFMDNGQGIAFSHQENIFTMFYRASESSFGSGLGLYLAREVIKKLGGKISFESEAGRGTVFYVNLPDLQMKPKTKR